MMEIMGRQRDGPLVQQMVAISLIFLILWRFNESNRVFPTLIIKILKKNVQTEGLS